MLESVNRNASTSKSKELHTILLWVMQNDKQAVVSSFKIRLDAFKYNKVHIWKHRSTSLDQKLACEQEAHGDVICL